MLNNNHIGYLHFWCQKVLPLVYDNSLSYYEVLLKIRNKLNEVIKFTNDIPEYIDQKFIEAFDEGHLKELISEVFRTIEDAITANNEGTNTHFANEYSEGTLLWHDNKLYKAKHHIDIGDTIVVDSNIELVSFSDMFQEFIDEVKGNFTLNDDGSRETSSTDRPVHDLVWLNNMLYEVIKPISEGNAYIYTGSNANVKQTSLDDIYDYLADLISSEVDAREHADDLLNDAVDGLSTQLGEEKEAREGADTELSDKIDELETKTNNKIGDLSNLNTTEKTNLVNAINEVNSTGGGAIAKIGDLENLLTSNKTTIVGALNEVFNDNDYQDVVGVKKFGAKCDGVTDDSDALIAAVSNCTGKVLVLNGDMVINKHIRLNNPITINGNGHTVYVGNNFSGSGNIIAKELFGITGQNICIENLTINGTQNNDLGNAFIFNGARNCLFRKININNVKGTAIWCRDDNWNLHFEYCQAYQCDMSERFNGGGVFATAMGTGTVANHYISFDHCKADSCGNGGFQLYDVEFGIVSNCWACNLQAPDNWEVGNGFMAMDNVLIANCRATEISNAAYYIIGNNNTVIGCTAHTCGNQAVDLYTGNQVRYGNSILSCAFEACALTPHTAQYARNSIVAGTHQVRLVVSDINITGGGNTGAPTNIIGFENLVTSTINNVNAFDIINVGNGLVLTGENGRDNRIQNCNLMVAYSISPFQPGTVIINCDTGYGNYQWADLTGLTAGETWWNHTYRNIALFIDGTISGVNLSGQSLGVVNCVVVPPNNSINVTGSNLVFHGIAW